MVSVLLVLLHTYVLDSIAKHSINVLATYLTGDWQTDSSYNRHDTVFLNLQNKPDWYVKRIPSSQVPGLIVEDDGLYGSLIIADFLDEKYSERPLHSKDPLQKAKDRILLESFGRVESAFYKLLENFKSPEEYISNLITELIVFDKDLIERKSKFYGGENPGMVDYMIWPWFERMDAVKLILQNKLELPETKLPLLVSWIGAMKEDVVVKEYLLSPEVHANYLETYMAGNPDYIVPCRRRPKNRT